MVAFGFDFGCCAVNRDGLRRGLRAFLYCQHVGKRRFRSDDELMID